MKGTVSRSVTYNFVTLWTVTLWTVAHQAPLSTGFSKQEYQSGLPFPFPWDLPNLVIEPGSLTLQADSLPSELPEKPYNLFQNLICMYKGQGKMWSINKLTI